MRPLLLNRLVGLGLTPFACIFGAALILLLRLALAKPDPVAGPFWRSHDFLWFSGGALLWLACFCASIKIWKRPRLMRAYVLGHELMHAFMAILSLGKIKDYRVSLDGGYIVTNRYNFIIALAPYLWPFYSVPVLALWSLSFCWHDALNYRDWFLGARIGHESTY